MTYRTGIDLSNHNGDIDFQFLKRQGIDFAILRTGYGGRNPNQRDRKFEEYYEQCKKYGINVGAYHFSYGLTEKAVLDEADFMLEIVKGKQFEYPLFFDIETIKHTTLSKAVCGELVTAFCERLEENGYFAGVYSFDSFFASNLPDDLPKRFTSWVARVENVKPTFTSNYGIWQYSWKGNLEGIPSEVDMNRSYVDYPEIIKKKKLNGYGEDNKLYRITAETEETSREKAMFIAKTCKELGMTVTVDEEKL